MDEEYIRKLEQQLSDAVNLLLAARDEIGRQHGELKTVWEREYVPFYFRTPHFECKIHPLDTEIGNFLNRDFTRRIS